MDAGSHTFLFADLVGFTALAELEGDDRALEVVLAMQRRVRALLARHGAEEVKSIGDGVMLRCRDPRQAVVLGLALVSDLDEGDGLPPVRVGIHTGPALSSDGDWYGRTVNVAARLCAVAPGGEVMVSEATRHAALTVAGIDWGARELHWLRNVSEPVAAYLISPCAERRFVPGPEASHARPARRAGGLLTWVCPKAKGRGAIA